MRKKFNKEQIIGILRRQIIENLYPLIKADAIAQDKAITLELGEIPKLLVDEKEIR